MTEGLEKFQSLTTAGLKQSRVYLIVLTPLKANGKTTLKSLADAMIQNAEKMQTILFAHLVSLHPTLKASIARKNTQTLRRKLLELEPS